MAYIPWPFACVKTWNEQRKPNVIRSNVEEGYPKTRRRFTKAWSEIQVSFVLPWSDRKSLEDFLEKTTQDGTQPFLIFDPMMNENRLVRWKEMPNITGSPDTKPTFGVSGTLETVFS